MPEFENNPAYPVVTELRAPPERFERVQLALRLLISLVIGALQASLGGLLGFLYILLPATAAILISRRGADGYLHKDSRWLSGCLEWVVGLYAYMLLVTDRFPLDTSSRQLRMQVTTAGTPSVGSALLRLLTSLPHAIVLALLGVVSAVLWVICAVSILVNERCPASMRAFQRDLVGWIARVLAYHASLVDTYPPFGFVQTGAERPSAGQTGQLHT